MMDPRLESDSKQNQYLLNEFWRRTETDSDKFGRIPDLNPDDLISRLPDNLLITIMSSSLTMKEAATTSILSTRWKKLWTYYYAFLDFKFDDDSHHLCAASDYVYCVNKVLNSHQQFGGVPINKLRICWSLSNHFKTDIDSWINFVHKNRVQHFELDLTLTIRSTRYKLPLETLPAKFGFPYLSVLRLCFVDLTDDALSYLLSSNNCPSLQHVSLKYALSLKHVKVVGNLMLKSLEFDLCFFMEDIMISSAVNMVSFGFSGRHTTKVTFENVPLLTEASFGGLYWMNVAIIPIAPQLLSFLSQLEILRLDFVGEILHFGIFESSKFPEFKRVKHLEVQANPPCTGCLTPNVLAMIFGCPRLQKFSLKMVFIVESDADSDSDAYSDSDGEDQDIHYQHQHQCLRAVEFKGWDGNKDELELIAKLLNISVLLEKVTVEFQIQDNRKREGARKAAEKLRTILPQTVSLVLL